MERRFRFQRPTNGKGIPVQASGSTSHEPHRRRRWAREYALTLNAFVAVPASDMAENVLKQRNMVYERNCQYLYVYGNDSDFFASFLNTDARRPMQHGVLNSREEMSQQIIQLIIKKLVPQARTKGDALASRPGMARVLTATSSTTIPAQKLSHSLGSHARRATRDSVVLRIAELELHGHRSSCGGGMCTSRSLSVHAMTSPSASRRAATT